MNKIPIDKKTLEYIAELARIEIAEKDEEKLLNDLQKILAHFEELKEVNTENVEPTRPPEFAQAKSGAVAGGTTDKNVFREDEAEERGKRKEESEKLINQFPEEKDGFLKIPPVFK